MTIPLICIVASVLLAPTLVHSTPYRPRPMSQFIQQSQLPQTQLLYQVEKLIQGEQSQGVQGRRNRRQYLLNDLTDDSLREIGHKSGLSNLVRFIRQQPYSDTQDVTIAKVVNGKAYQRRESAPVKDELNLSYNPKWDNEVKQALLEANGPMSELEVDQFTKAFLSAKAKGLTKTAANLFAEQMVYIQLILRVNGLQLGTTMEDYVEAFKTAARTGIAKGMSKSDTLQFAVGMVGIQGVFGVQDSTGMNDFAESYYAAISTGSQEGLSKYQATVFGQTLLRVHADFGVEILKNEVVLRDFAQAFNAMWDGGVDQGMTQTQVTNFVKVMLQVQPRIGTLPEAKLISSAKAFLSALETFYAQGKSAAESVLFSQRVILSQAGVSLFSSKETGGYGYGTESSEKRVDSEQTDGYTDDLYSDRFLKGRASSYGNQDHFTLQDRPTYPKTTQARPRPRPFQRRPFRFYVREPTN